MTTTPTAPTTTTAATAAQRLADRIDQMSPHRVHNLITTIESGTLTVGTADEAAIIVRAARQNLATRTDRFWLSAVATADGRAQIIDQARRAVALVCHPTTAESWLRWYRGEPTTPGLNNDYRVCACRHLCLSHSSERADYTQAPGVGNGMCGIDGCRCEAFRPAVDRPARFAG